MPHTQEQHAILEYDPTNNFPLVETNEDVVQLLDEVEERFIYYGGEREYVLFRLENCTLAARQSGLVDLSHHYAWMLALVRSGAIG